MSLVVRDAVAHDAEAILGFIRSLAECERLAESVAADEDRIRETLFGANPKAFCGIAEWRGEPAGFALWFYNYSTFLARHGIWLEDLFVRPELRGRGIGKELLKSLARRCVDEDLGRLEWSVLDWNEPSIRFYRSLGAQHMREWQVFRLTGPDLAGLAVG